MDTITPSTTAAVCLLRGLGDVTRLSILRLLSNAEMRTVDVVDALDIPQSTASKHLACLRECGLVDARPAGRATFHTLAHPESTLALLRAAETLLQETGEAGTLCANFGVGAPGTLA